MMPAVIFSTQQALGFELPADTSVALAGITQVADMTDDILLKWVFYHQRRVIRIANPAERR